MRGFNQVILVGNAGKAAEMKKLTDGTSVAKINLATTLTFRTNKGELQSQTDWHTIILWRGLAELAEKFVQKGSYLMIKGKLKPRQYKNAEGQTVYISEVIADELLLLDKPVSSSDESEIPDETMPF